MSKTQSNISNTRKKPEAFYISLTLVIGGWKKWFSEQEYRLIIAEALNYRDPERGSRERPYVPNPCIDEHDYYKKKNELTVAGYLITERRVCLILEGLPEEVDRQIDIFCCHVWEEIKCRLKERRNYFELLELEENAHFRTLFEKTTLINQELIQLLIGRELKYRYNISTVERMKATLSASEFCSVIDYSGAEGPVFVKKLRNHRDPLRHPVIHPYGVLDYSKEK